MRTLSPADILVLWEKSSQQPPPERALTLLAVASGEPLSADLTTLTIGERDRRLWEVRENAFGPAVEALATCPACGQRIEFRFLVADVRVDSNPASGREHELTIGPWKIRFRLPNSGDIGAVAGMSDHERCEARLAARCLLRAERDGAQVGGDDIPAEAWAAVQRRMSELDPQAEVRLSLLCPVCDHIWEALFDIADFLWTELAALARQLLREVDVLARVYGWSESEVLALSRARRAAYLELAGA